MRESSSDLKSENEPGSHDKWEPGFSGFITTKT
jgi:hypothetical protein